MRIISTRNDYYDSCRAYGEDSHVQWVRHYEEVEVTRDDYQDKNKNEYTGAFAKLAEIRQKMPRPPLDLQRAVLSFCGKAYPFYWLRDQQQGFYDLDQLLYWLGNQKKTISFDPKEYTDNLKDRARKKYRYWRYYRHYGDLSPETWEEFCEEVDLEVGDDPHIYFRTPILALGPSQEGNSWTHPGLYLMRNPNLKEFSFATQVDPFECYQQLSMYVGNNLVQQMDPNPPISDELKAETHGFDKWSFRTHPLDSKKPRRKK